MQTRLDGGAEHGFDALLAGPVTTRTRAADAAARKARPQLGRSASRDPPRRGHVVFVCSLILEEALLGLPACSTRRSRTPHRSRASLTTFGDWRAGRRTADRAAGIRAISTREAPAADEGRDVQDLFCALRGRGREHVGDVAHALHALPAFAEGAYAGLTGVELFVGALSLVVLLYSGWPFLRGAMHAARVRRATMDTLVVVGTWSAWLYSLYAALSHSGGTYFESAAMITVIVLLAGSSRPRAAEAPQRPRRLQAGVQSERGGCLPKRPPVKALASMTPSAFLPNRSLPATSWQCEPGSGFHRRRGRTGNLGS